MSHSRLQKFSRYLLGASVAGLVLGLGIAFLREFMDSSVQTADDLAADQGDAAGQGKVGALY